MLAGAALPLVAGACMRTGPVAALADGRPLVGGAIAQRRIAVAAPFAMPNIAIPDFTGAPQFPITTYGAASGDKDATGRAIAQAIAAAAAAGGGRVTVPAGTWETGPIHLRSNIELHLPAGAVLLFSDDPADYLPPVQTSWEGIECMNYSPLVYAFDCENVAITGSGRLEAKMDTWTRWSGRPKPHMDALVELYEMAVRNVPVSRRDMTSPAISGGQAHLRPHFIQFNRCRHVLIEGVSIRNSPFWTIHPLLCRDVAIRGVKVRALGHNNDGVDPEMSQNVLIEHCEFDQGDDAISVKAGRNQDAWRLATPSRNIVMRHCRMLNGHQLMAIGSELSGGVENVLVHDCHFDPAGSGGDSSITNLLFVKTNERRGGFVRNIHMRDVSATTIAGGVLSVDTDVLYQWRDLVPTYERRLTAIEGLHVADIRVGKAAYLCSIKGQAEQPVRDVTLDDVTIAETGGQALRLEHAVNVRVDGRAVSGAG